MAVMFDLNWKQFREYCEPVFHAGARVKARRIVAGRKVVSCHVAGERNACEMTVQINGSAPQPYHIATPARSKLRSARGLAGPHCPNRIK
jgi:hypothetical protein